MSEKEQSKNALEVLENEKVPPTIEQEQDRGQWSNHFEYFLSSLGLAVGLGNLWRFPYICYQNGGGSFLIPYLTCLLFVGLPIFFMEMVFGQYAGLSATKIYGRLAPFFRGMGFGVVTIPTIVNFYYTVIMAYAFYYIFRGFVPNGELPWGLCDNDFNSPNCYSLLQAEACTANQTFFDRICMEIDTFCEDHNLDFGLNDNGEIIRGCFNSSGYQFKFEEIEFRSSPSEEFYYKDVLGLKVNFTEAGVHIITEGDDASSWSDWGAVNWKIAGCLALCWTLVCLSLIKGVQSYGKVVYFTTLFPYVVLTITLIYVATTLDGVLEGIKFYLVPRDWSKLLEVKVWNEAASQIFYSLSAGEGSQLILSSYNPFRNNAHRDALLIAVCNSLTSIYAGFVVFGVLGYMSVRKGVDIEDVVESGPSLAFIVYPEAVTVMNPGPFFSFIFFFMLTVLAISSICGGWEAFVASLMDEFPQLRNKRVAVMVVSCFIAFLFGFPMCFDSGYLLFQLMDNRTASAVLVMALLEVVLMSWIYGAKKFMGHIAEMSMKIPAFMRYYWLLCWYLLTPGIIAFITIFYWVQKDGSDGTLDYVYPAAASALGWFIELVPLGIVVCFCIVIVFNTVRKGNSLKELFKPKDSWGPRPDSGLRESIGVDNINFVSP